MWYVAGWNRIFTKLRRGQNPFGKPQMSKVYPSLTGKLRLTARVKGSKKRKRK